MLESGAGRDVGDETAETGRAPSKRFCRGKKRVAEESVEEGLWWVARKRAAWKRSKKACTGRREQLKVALCSEKSAQRTCSEAKEGALAVHAAELDRVGLEGPEDQLAWTSESRLRQAANRRSKELRECWEDEGGAHTRAEALKTAAVWEEFRAENVFEVDLARAEGAGVGIWAKEKVVFRSGGNNVLRVPGVCVSGQWAYDPSSTIKMPAKQSAKKCFGALVGPLACVNTACSARCANVRLTGYWRCEGIEGGVMMVGVEATRSIAAGEELLLSYDLGVEGARCSVCGQVIEAKRLGQGAGRSG